MVLSFLTRLLGLTPLNMELVVLELLTRLYISGAGLDGKRTVRYRPLCSLGGILRTHPAIQVVAVEEHDGIGRRISRIAARCNHRGNRLIIFGLLRLHSLVFGGLGRQIATLLLGDG